MGDRKRQGAADCGRAAVRLAGWLAFGLLPSSGFALDPDVPVHRYGVQNWGTEQGLPHSSPMSVVQSGSGYLWFTNDLGVTRFDGRRFVRFDHRSQPPIPGGRATSIAADASGGVVVANAAGVFRAPRDSAPAWQRLPAWSDAAPTVALLMTQVGELWAANALGGIATWTEGAWVRQRPDAGESARVTRMAEAPDGSIWVATAGAGILQLAKGRPAADVPGVPRRGITAIAFAADGDVWLGTYGSGLHRWRDGTLSAIDAGHGVPSDAIIDSLLLDRDGVLWIGTQGHGLRRFVADRAEAFEPGHGLADAGIVSIAEDREGNVWVGATGRGLFRIREVPFTSFGRREGLTDLMVWSVTAHGPEDVWGVAGDLGIFRFDGSRFEMLSLPTGIAPSVATSVLADPERGSVWVGTSAAGLLEWSPDAFRPLTTTPPLDGDFVQGLFKDRAGRLWVQTLAYGKLQYLEDGTLHVLDRGTGFDARLAYAYADGPEGAVWIGSLDDGLVRFREGNLERWTTREGLTSNRITALLAEPDGALWIGTADAGVMRLREGRVEPVGAEQGLPWDQIFSITADEAGRFWMTGSDGIFYVRRDDLAAVASGARQQLDVVRFGRNDGLASTEFNGGHVPASAKTGDGRLWFPTTQGLAMVDVRRLQSNTLAPTVLIEQVWVDGMPAPDLSRRGVAFGNHRVDFQFTATSLQAPEFVRFRHQLIGYDPAPIESSDAHRVSYTNLPSGSYTFWVTASNNSGVWNTVGARLGFEVPTPFHRQPWFLASVLGLIAGLAYWGHRVRLLPLRSENAILGERNRIAREIHDTVAQGIVGIRLQIEIAMQQLSSRPDDALRHLRVASQLAEASVEEAHQAVWALRTPCLTEDDFVAALRLLLTSLAEPAGLAFELDLRRPLPAVGSEVQFHALRVVREAVVNAVRHADATRLRIVIDDGPSGIRISVEDDGHGFEDDAAAGAHQFGLVGMRERAERIGAALHIRSTPDTGTVVSLDLPQRQAVAAR